MYVCMYVILYTHGGCVYMCVCACVSVCVLECVFMLIRVFATSVSLHCGGSEQTPRLLNNNASPQIPKPNRTIHKLN